MYYIKHLKNDFWQMIASLTLMSFAFVAGTYLFTNHVQVHGFWLTVAAIFLWIYAIAFPAFTVIYLWTEIPSAKNRAKKIGRTISALVDGRIEKDIERLQKKVLSANPGLDQARILLQDVAIALGLGAEVDDLGERFAKIPQLSLSLSYDANYIRRPEERDAETNKVVRGPQPERGVLSLTYRIAGGQPQSVSLTIWSEN